MFKKVFYNTGAQIGGKIVTAAATLLVTLLIGRSLGPAGYGEFVKIFVFVGYFYTLADFGLNAIYIKINPTPDTRLLSILFGLRLLMGIALAAAATAISLLLPYDPVSGTGFSPLVKAGIAIASLTILTQALYTTANAYFQKILRYDLSTLAAIFASIIILLGTIAVYAANGSLLGFAAAYVIGGLALVAVAFSLIAKRTGRLILPRFAKTQSWQLLKLASPIGLALVFNLIYFRIDVFILANSRPAAEVGLYGLAYQFFEAALAVPIFFANAIYPLLTQLYAASFSQFQKQLAAWLKILTATSVLLAVALVIIASLIPAIYDQRFAGSVPALQILALGMPFFFLSALLWHVLIIKNRQQYLIYIYGAGAGANIIANLILIPLYGYLAAAATTVASEALVLGLLISVWRKT